MRKPLFTLLCLLSMATSSCDDAPSTSIPNVYVGLECNLTQAQFSPIRTPNEFVEVTRDKHNIPVGYAGIIVGQSPFDGFCAFDMCCPVEVNRSIAVHLKKGAIGIAVCNKCGEEYNLSNGGYPTKGISKEYLKRYSVNTQGIDLLFVHN